MNFYKRHLGDIAKACGHLSQGQMGAYDLLLDWLYGNEKPLPLDQAALHRIGRASTKAERDNVDAVLAEFFIRSDAGYTQKRVGEEIAKANAQAETNRRIAEEREARKRERNKHESSTNRSTNGQPSQTPDTRHQTETDASRHTPPAAAGSVDRLGTFEGHAEPVVTPNPVAAYAIALTRLGFRCTSLNPDLVAYQQAGGTVDHLAQCASLPECQGKPATYAIRIARRELAEPAKAIVPGACAGPVRALSKTAEAFLTLEAMKSENRLDARRGAEGTAKAAVLVAGPDPGE